MRFFSPVIASVVACRTGGTVEVTDSRASTDTDAPADTSPVATHSSVDEGPTWQDVAPILKSRCVTCHRDGEVAPMALDTWEGARPWAPSIAQVTRDRIMPPYLVDPLGDCQEYTDPGWLSDPELDLLQAWADAGAPAGGPTERLVPSELAHLDAPDAVLDMGVAFTPTEPPDQYRCFIADPGLTQDEFMTAFEVVPGAPAMVHHVALFTLDSEAAERQAVALDAADELPGYDCFGGAGVRDSRQVAGWAVGTPTTRLPEGTGLRLHAERPVVISMHYHTTTPVPDRTVVRLELEETVPVEALVLRPYDATMILPPGQSELSYTFDTDLTHLLGAPLGATLYGVFPHAHERARSLHLEVVRAGTNECLADVPHWDFNWQRTYFYQEPIRVEPTDILRVSCVYDTSLETEPVVFGESTDDEMCVFGILATL